MFNPGIIDVVTLVMDTEVLRQNYVNETRTRPCAERAEGLWLGIFYA